MKKAKKGIVIVVVVLGVGLALSYVKYGIAQVLVSAIEKEDVKKVEWLLDHGVSPNTGTAPTYGIHGTFRRMTESSPDYPLSTACFKGNYEIVKLLIDHGASVDFSKIGGWCWSPLYSAVLGSYKPNTLQIVDLLLKNGADVHYKEGGRYPIEEAARMSPLKYEGNSKTGVCDEEKATGITEVVKLLLVQMEDYDINGSAQTLLMNAAISGNIALSEYLLSIGADKTLKSSADKTAYDYAIDNGHVELAELLKP